MKRPGNSAVADNRESADDDESLDAVQAASDDDDESANSSVDEEKQDRPPRRRWRRWIRPAMRWAAVVVFVAVAAGAGYEGWLLFQQRQNDAAAAQALDAAEAYAVTLTSTDPNAIDKNTDDVLAGATGDFKDNYTKASAQLRKLMIDNKVSTQGNVVDSAIKSATADEVEVLLFVSQSVSNSTMPEPRTDLIAVAMTMSKEDGRWLASEIVLLSG